VDIGILVGCVKEDTGLMPLSELDKHEYILYTSSAVVMTIWNTVVLVYSKMLLFCMQKTKYFILLIHELLLIY
jgi:hypothetical protein